MGTSHSRRGLIGRGITAVALAITAAGLAAATATPHAAAGAARHAAPPPVSAQALAQARAKATGHRVTVSALTTPTSQTTANPDGSLTVTESARPVRARHDGTWASLNSTLQAGPDGTVSPAITINGLTLSGGGTGPLAVTSVEGRTLSLSWPGTLPAPTLSGSTATYAGVLPGVDLVITVDDQGDFSDTLVVHSAAAAANPALASLGLGYTSPDLALSGDGAGGVTAAAGPGQPAVITAQAPRIWDSAPPPAGMPTITGPDGTVVNAASGLPAYSSVTAPGAAAHTAAVPVSLSATAITLSPPASVLTGPGVTYPVYIDPTWHPVSSDASAWTQVDSGFPGQRYWNESSGLQVGKCPVSLGDGSCNGMGVARSFIRMPIPTRLTTSSVINSADLYMTEYWAPSCTKTSVRLYTTGGISSSTTWNNQPSWSSDYQWQDAAYGYPNCPQGGYKKYDITWDVKSTVANDAGQRSTQTWGLRAADETDEYAWKLFRSWTSNLTLSLTYNDPPNHPGNRSSSPGGSCQYTASSAPVIGNDDVTLYASASDDDGDNSLSTKFYLVDSTGSTVFTSTDTAGNNAVAQAVITRDDFKAYGNDDGLEHTYHWYARTTDDNGLTSTMPADECYFKYNPAAPGAPQVTLPSPAQGTLGQTIQATFDPAPGTACPGNTCPVSYTYQLAAGTPITVPATSGSWSGSITITRTGPIMLTVSASDTGGNPGEAVEPVIQGLPPQQPYADGDINGDGQPDLLTVGSSAKPGLWLSPGTGPGSVGNASDIGGAGTSINPNADGPGDWSGAQVLHGDFTGNDVQDVMAYYPSGNHAGTAVVLAGSGDGGALQPFSGSSWLLPPGTLQDPVTGDVPQSLVAAGNASQMGTGIGDLIGIAGDTTTSPDNYTLDLFTSCSGCGPGYYGLGTAVLSAQAPGGDSWHHYTLATVQPGGNPSDVVLFALDTATGVLWESTNPTPANGPCTDYTQSTCTVIGTPNSTWTQITAPWGSNPPTLVSGDVNSTGKAELWAATSSTATAYTLTGSTLSKEATAPIAQPYNDWPLAEGSGSTAADTTGGQDATLNNGATWTDEDTGSSFGNYITADGSTGYLTPPAGTIPGTATTPKITVWFRTTTAGGVLASLDSAPLPASGGTGTATGSFDPVLYIGTDGHLYGEWWNGSALTPAISASPVDDGLWHRAVLTGYGTSQTLYLDSQPGVTINGTINLTNQGSDLSFGSGYIARNWPSEPYYQQSDGHADYFTGDIAHITYSYPGGP